MSDEKRGYVEFMVNHCGRVKMQAIRVLELDYALVERIICL
jgi:hypothetical protein